MPALDGLRGLAVLLVLASHCALMVSERVRTPLDHFVDLTFGAGWIGVDLFFVLSGFLITGILLATRDSPAYYRSFFARRFLRIFPLYYLVVFVTVLITHQRFNTADKASLLFFYYNWHAVLLGHHLPNVNSFWSLAVEEQFYLVWPTTILFLTKKSLLRLCLVGMAVALGMRLIVLVHSFDFQSAYYLTPCRMDTILLGSLLAIWRTDKVAWRHVERLAAPVALCAAVGLFGIAAWTGHFYDSITIGHMGVYRHTSIAVLGPGCTLLALLFGAILVMATGQGRVFRFFRWHPLCQVGKYSYGMYMLHWIILMQIRWHVMIRFIRYLPTWSAAIVYFVLLMLITYGAAYISFHVFERHFLSLKRRFPASREQASSGR